MQLSVLRVLALTTGTTASRRHPAVTPAIAACLQMHTVFIWALAMPLLLATITYQSYYQSTTAVERLLTLQVCLL